ncbi:putative uncharacterized protein [Burkholderiales bacterium GJ-E10]|nr:putative uncharacterized protein [Burkholderiales bacterium GJ-E10]
MFIPKMIRFATVFAAAMAVAGLAYAQEPPQAPGTWNQQHPRRAEVNRRLGNQNARINREYRQGEISRQQARRMHRQDHRLRMEERRMARRNHGAITRQQQRRLNRQENGMSRRIGG